MWISQLLAERHHVIARDRDVRIDKTHKSAMCETSAEVSRSSWTEWLIAAQQFGAVGYHDVGNGTFVAARVINHDDAEWCEQRQEAIEFPCAVSNRNDDSDVAEGKGARLPRRVRKTCVCELASQRGLAGCRDGELRGEVVKNLASLRRHAEKSQWRAADEDVVCE